MYKPDIIIFDSLECLDALNIPYKLVDFETKEDALKALSTGATLVAGKTTALRFDGKFYDLVIKNENLRDKVSQIIKKMQHTLNPIQPHLQITYSL